MNVLDTVAPMKEVRLKIEQDEILDLMKNRDKFLYSFKKYNLQEDFEVTVK